MAAWRMYNVPADWQYGAIALRHVVGCFLIILHVWTSISIYEVLGDFGWYYGDFFVNKEKLPKLKYTGVYRYLNNPERIMGSSTFWGFALLSNSKAIFALAVQAQIANALFIKFVEQPHMAKLYAGELRKEAGFVRSLKTMPIVDQPAFKNKVSEVTGSMDKVVQDTMTVVEEFIVAAKPRWEGLKKESSVRLSRYQGSLTITRTTDCLDDLDMSQYSVRLHRTRQIDNDSPFVYQLGEPIQAIWAAPANHSATDWIGLYKITDNVSRELTKVASKGRWSGLDQAEWSDHNDNILECHESGGSIEFRGDTLPWSSGFYELRYHHDGKHNVMAISQPFQIVVETSTEQDMYKVEREVLELVQQILGSEKGVIAPKNVEEEIDFAENAEKYAGRLAYGIDKKFGVDFAWQLVETDASVHNITARIARSRKTLGPFVRSS